MEVTLRNLKISDINKNYLSWFKSRNVKFIENAKQQKSIENLKNYYLNLKRGNKKTLFLAIISKKKLHVGNIKFEESNIKGKVYMGILIGNTKYTNIGLSEIIFKKSEKIFKRKFKINKYFLRVKCSNILAVKSYLKNNFKIVHKNKKYIEMVKII